MNLLLLDDSDRRDDGTWRVTGRRAEHIRKVLRLEPGDRLRAGLLNGPRGRARVLALYEDAADLAFEAEREAPPALPLCLIVALPRPPMLRRLLVDITTLGIKDLVLVHSHRVEKSFWQSPELGADKIRDKLITGLEQAGDTRLPRVHLQPYFRPFVEDELPCFARDSRCLLAHPGDDAAMPCDLTEPVTLAVGPEGGWIDYEVDWFRDQGFACVGLGERILKVDTAVPTLVGRIMRLV
jgi:RsmE family RNA methyltransferase